MLLGRSEEPNRCALSNLLDKPDVTLKEVLDDDGILQELKQGNKRLIEYLSKPENLIALTTLCITEPTATDENDNNGRKKHKYGNLASEIFCTDIPDLTQALAKCQDCLRILSSFVPDRSSVSASSNALDPLLASFFAKVFNHLVGKQLGRMLEFMQAQPVFLDNLISNLDVSAIMESLFRLGYGNADEEDTYNMKQWLAEQQFVSKIVAKFDPICSMEMHQNASFLLCELIRFLRNVQYGKDEKSFDPLLDQLQSSSVLKDLLGRMFPEDTITRNDSIILNCCTIFLTYLQTVYIPHDPLAVVITLGTTPRTSDETSDNSAESTANSEVTIWNPDPDRIVEKCLLDRLIDIKRVLTEDNKESLTTPMGVVQGSLGSARVALLKLLVQMLANGLPEVHYSFVQLGLLQDLMDLFFKHQWNNFLHTSVVNVVVCAYNCRLPYLVNEECNEEDPERQPYYPSPLMKQALADVHILKLLVDKCQGVDDAKNLPTPRPAYIGHLLLIASATHSALQEGPFILVTATQKIFRGLPADERESWNQFVDNQLLPYMKRCEPDQVVRLRGDIDAMAEKDSLVDDSGKLEAASLAFTEYDNLKLTIDVPTDFGFASDAFTSDPEEPVYELMAKAMDINFDVGSIPEPCGEAAFEEMCMQRISLSNDSDDEDLK